MTSLLRINLPWSTANTPIWRWGDCNNPTTWGLPLLLRLLILMAAVQPHSCLSCLLLTPLFIPGRIDFPWKLSDVKGLLALWCQHSVISLSVFLYIISGTLFFNFLSLSLFLTPLKPYFPYLHSPTPILFTWWILLSFSPTVSTSWSHTIFVWHHHVWKTH